MEVVIFLICIFISSFLLFVFSRHDFVLLRQNISLAQIFDLAIFVVVFAFLGGRIFFILNNFDVQLLHVLRFFHVLKFPGISSLGFALGGALAVVIFFGKKKAVGRILDIFSIAFFPLYIFSIVSVKYQTNLIFVPIIFTVLSILLFAFFVKSHNKYI